LQQSKREDLDPHQRDAIISIVAASGSESKFVDLHYWIHFCLITKDWQAELQLYL
jgi:hypothetical protein